MEFFNKKEEVLEIVLTQKGKELYAAGLFLPEYYSFHDSDIVYESKFIEEQNDIVPRVKAVPTLKQNTSVHSNLSDSTILRYPQKLYCELGNKSLTDQYKPAWQINFKKSPPFQYIGNRDIPTVSSNYQIKLSSSFDNNNSNQEVIPQIDIQTIYGFAEVTGTADIYFVKDSPTIIDVMEYNSFEESEFQEFDVEAYFIKDGETIKKLSFNQNLENSIFKYINIQFDKSADFEENIHTKDIYGELVDKDDSTC